MKGKRSWRWRRQPAAGRAQPGQGQQRASGSWQRLTIVIKQIFPHSLAFLFIFVCLVFLLVTNAFYQGNHNAFVFYFDK